MRTLDEIKTVFAAIADRFAAVRRTSRFTCGDCERNEQCGLPPDGECVVKAAQLARDEDYQRRAPAGYYKAVWPR